MTLACPCDRHGNPLPDNVPGLSRVVIRRGDWRSIRRALLAMRDPVDALADWRPGNTGDPATMIAEWWATLGEVLEFYTDAIGNEAFLATAAQRASTVRLIALLGYRPRPALAATARVAAIVAGRDTVIVPRGYAIDSVAAPGKSPQTFEVDFETRADPGGRTRAQTPAQLARPEAGVIHVAGRVIGVAAGDRLRLRTPAGDRLLHVTALALAEGKPDRTRIAVTAEVSLAGLVARDCRLERAGTTAPAWTFVGSAVVGSDLHLAGIVRAARVGEPVLVTATGRNPRLVIVTALADTIWFANATASPAVSPGASGLPVAHSRLTLAEALPADWPSASTTVHTGWVEVGRLVDQAPPPWTGSPATLSAIAPDRFSLSTALAAQIADADGRGVPVSLTAASNATATATIAAAYADDVALAAPLDVLTRLLAVTRGKTVPREVLGSGDVSLSGQSFMLAKAPVSYVRAGAGYRSPVEIDVAGVPWVEVATFYGVDPGVAVFTLSEDEAGRTRVQFGDGVNGRRLPTGRDNVVARYRFGAGAEAPGAGKLTRLASPLPGLTRILNPVAAGGGADAEAARAIRRYAPRSVLTLGRAVSVADFAAFAAAAADPQRTRAVWAWDETRQRTAVTIYVAGDASVRAAVRDALAAVSDPLRPVSVRPARNDRIIVAMTLKIAEGYDAGPLLEAARTALTGEGGLFGAERMAIGQSLFVSAISAAVLPVAGVVTILTLQIVRAASGAILTGALHRTSEDVWFDLADDDLTIGVVANG